MKKSIVVIIIILAGLAFGLPYLLRNNETPSVLEPTATPEPTPLATELMQSPTPTPRLTPSPAATPPPSPSLRATPFPTPTPSPSPTAAAPVTVEITGAGFSPATVTIRAGATVRFVNKDTTPHWPASDPHPVHTDCAGFDSLRGLARDEAFSFTFAAEKDCGYHDHLRPGLKGTIGVQ